MDTYVYTEDTFSVTTVVDLANDDRVFINAGVTVGSRGVAAGISGQTGNALQIFGTLIGGYAYLSDGGDQSIFIGASGTVAGSQTGIALDAGHCSVVNEGTISGNDYALRAYESGHSIINSGHITATFGKGIALDGGTIVNSGVIQSAAGDAITFAGILGSMSAVQIENSGTIQTANAARFAIWLPFRAVTVHNTGHIIGNVQLSNVADLYEGSEGTLTGVLDAGRGDDFMFGGASADIFQGGKGSDTMEAGGGHDLFVYRAVNESGGTAIDIITDFDARADHIDLDVVVTGVDIAFTAGQLREGHFTKDLKNAVGGSHLGTGHAVLFTPDSGDLAGHTYLVVDADGVAGYKADLDYVIEVTDATHLDRLNVHTFI